MDADSSQRARRPMFRRSLATPALLCLVLLGLAGCGTQLLYNRLDTLLYFYISSQVSLQDPQAKDLKRQLQDFLDWHRRNELPRYAEFAEALATDAQHALGRDRIDLAGQNIETFWRESVLRGGPDAARWLQQLALPQREELFASLAEDDADLRTELCTDSAEKRSKRRDKTFISTVEDWVGRLSEQQRTLVRQRLVTLTPTGCGWVEQRAAQRAELRHAVDTAASDPAYAQTLARLMAQPEDRWDRQYRASFEANRARVIDLLAALDVTFTAKQRRRLSARLLDFARDFRELAAAPGRRGRAPERTAAAH